MKFNTNEICQKIKSCTDNKDENIINIPVIIYLNTLRIVSFKNKECVYKFFKAEEEDEDLITKSFFDLKIKHYLQKEKKKKKKELKNKKITISLFRQKRDLALLYEKKKKKIKINFISKEITNETYVNIKLPQSIINKEISVSYLDRNYDLDNKGVNIYNLEQKNSIVLYIKKINEI